MKLIIQGFLLFGFAGITFLSPSFAETDVKLPDKYEQCGSCHGPLGVSGYTFFPNIAGQKRTYMVKQLTDFRDGVRHDPWMTPIASDLTDEEIQGLADFFSALERRPE